MRHLVIIPARNEGRFVGDMLRSLLRQTEPPDRIVIVDDGSSDETGPIVAAVAAQHPSVQLLRHEARVDDVMGPAVVRAFTFAYTQLQADAYTYVSKFDADLVFPECYCATVLGHMDEHSDVGVAGGVLENEAHGEPVHLRVAPNHVAGALKTFRQRALDAIGGLEEISGWDIVDQVKLRMLGWRISALVKLRVLHRRAHGARNGRVLGKAHWGRGAWAIGSHPLFVLARGLYRMLETPYVIGGLAFWGGYLLAAVRGVPRIGDPAVVARLRKEQLHRLRVWNRAEEMAPVSAPTQPERGSDPRHAARNGNTRIAIFWNYLFHYRVPFYERLSRAPGVQLTVFHGGDEPNHGGKETIPVTGLSFQSVRIKTLERPLLGAAVYFQFGMWKYLLRKRYDVIVCEGNFGILSNVLIALYGKLAGSRVYYWAGGWERRIIRGFPARLRKLFIRVTARLADGYMCYGTNARAFLMRYGVDPALCTIVQNTIDTEQVRDKHAYYKTLVPQTRASLGLDGKLVVLSVGVLIPRKRHDLLIEAFKVVRSTRTDVALVLVGDGPEMGRLRGLVGSQGIPDVHFVGEAIANSGLYFALADLFVLPALGGLAINEAMAYGLPVICSEGDGTEQDLLIPEQTGLFFKKGDSQDLAEKMSRLLASHEKRQGMGELARAHLYRAASMSSMVTRFLTAVGEPAKPPVPTVSGTGRPVS